MHCADNPLIIVLLEEIRLISVRDNVIKLCEECELLVRFLIIQGCRPELVPKLKDTIGEY